jgi:glycolate oxidase FAD binding subunit
MIEWSGALRWLAADAHTDPARVRAWAVASGGHATLFARRPERSARFTLAADAACAARRLKATFDPAGIMNRGRLYADL